MAVYSREREDQDDADKAFWDSLKPKAVGTCSLVAGAGQKILQVGGNGSNPVWFHEVFEGKEFKTLYPFMEGGCFGQTEYNAWHLQTWYRPVAFEVLEAVAKNAYMSSFEYREEEYADTVIAVLVDVLTVQDNSYLPYAERTRPNLGVTLRHRVVDEAVTVTIQDTNRNTWEYIKFSVNSLEYGRCADRASAYLWGGTSLSWFQRYFQTVELIDGEEVCQTLRDSHIAVTSDPSLEGVRYGYGDDTVTVSHAAEPFVREWTELV